MSRIEVGDIVRYYDGSLRVVVEPDVEMSSDLLAVNWIASTSSAMSFRDNGPYHAKSDIWLHANQLTKVGRADD